MGQHPTAVCVQYRLETCLMNSRPFFFFIVSFSFSFFFYSNQLFFMRIVMSNKLRFSHGNTKEMSDRPRLIFTLVELQCSVQQQKKKKKWRKKKNMARHEKNNNGNNNHRDIKNNSLCVDLRESHKKKSALRLVRGELIPAARSLQTAAAPSPPRSNRLQHRAAFMQPN